MLDDSQLPEVPIQQVGKGGGGTSSEPSMKDLLAMLVQQQNVLCEVVARMSSHQDNNVAAPAGPAEATPPAPAGSAPPTPAGVLLRRELYSVPEELLKPLRKVQTKFEENVRKLQRARRGKDAVDKQLNFMTNEGSKEKLLYPPGVPRFKSAASRTELDEAYSKAVEAEYSFTCVVKKGATRREAVATLHWHQILHSKQIDAEAHNSHHIDKQGDAAKESFIKSLRKVVDDSYDMDVASDLGLEKPIKDGIAAKVLSDKFEAMYDESVGKVSKEMKALEEKAEKAAEEEQKKKKELHKADPSSLLDAYITKKSTGSQPRPHGS